MNDETQSDDNTLNLDMIMSTNGMLYDILDDVQRLFPESRLTLSQLNMIYLASKSSMPKLFLCALNEVGSKEIQNYFVNVQFEEPDGQSLTPLTMAAMSGNVAYVKTLLSNYDVDLERECNVIFDGLVVYGASALWVAAGMGHLQIVKMLVRRGANVNHNTKAQSSPLRAACYEGRLDIVKYLIENGADVNATNAFKNTCIMIAAYKGHTVVVDTLLKNGAHTNGQALCGATALHYAAESGHRDVVHLLIEHGAILFRNELGITAPLLAAERLHESVVDFFLTRPNLMDKEDRIEVLELLGATYANDKFRYNVLKAYEYLMGAMTMRYQNPRRIIRKRVMPPIPAYDDWFETENIPELLAIRLNHHFIHMESLTIRERILGRRNPELAQAIIYRGAVMADQSRFEQCQILWNYAIDIRVVNNITVERDLLRFAQLFSQILRVDMKRLKLEDILITLNKCQQEIQANRYKIRNPTPSTCPRLLVDHNEQNVITTMYLLKMVTHVARYKKKEIQVDQLDELYYVILRYIKCDTRLADGQTLLHLAVNSATPVDDFYTNEICKFPCYRTAVMLVNAGASASAVDVQRNTPLHTLVNNLQNCDVSAKQVERIANLLIDAGTHMDAVNDLGLTPAKACSNANLSSLLLTKQNAQTTLQCHAARCIASHNLQYKGLIPKTLESFVKSHGIEKLGP